MVGFVRMLHGEDIWIGILAAIPSLCGLFQIPGSIIGRSFNSYKKFIRPPALLWRIMYLPLVVMPLVGFSVDIRLGIISACMVVASLSSAVVGPIYNDWLAELVPITSRGFFFSKRNAIMTAVGATVGLIGAVILDTFTHFNMERNGFVTIFGLGLVCAAISQYFFDQMRDLQRRDVVDANLREGLHEFKKPFRDKSFRKVLIFIGIFGFGQAFAGNLFSAFALESLNMPFTYITGFGMMQALGTVVASKQWGFLADKYGTRPMLALGALGISLTPTMWLLCRPDHLVANTILLLICHFLIGTVWAGVNLCQFNILLATSPARERSTYLGAGMTVQSILSGIAPILGAAMMTALRPVGSVEMAYKGVFLATMLLRFISVFFLRSVREEGSAKIRETIRDLSRVTPRGYKAMRLLSRSTDFGTRGDAIRSAASANFALASDEIIKALHDPAPSVRREAASALAKLGDDPKACEALLHQLEDHPDLVEEETVEAIGEIGGAEAVPLLARYLQSPRSQVRRAAAKAMGRIGSHDAVEALVTGASAADDVELRRASLQALRMIGAVEASDAIVAALSDSHPSGRIAAAEAVSELKLWGAADALRNALSLYQDDASSELAYALGTVGNEGDIPVILEVASKTNSMITRRRCLLGVARLLGVEAEAYRLLLLEGMARDTALLEMLRPQAKKSSKLNVALERYSAGDEAGALDALVRGSHQPSLRSLAEPQVPELFLVAACFAAKHAMTS